jgi:vacuolar-type H+-ATPase subunit C/Vma6
MYEGDRLDELSRVGTVRELGMELYPRRDFRDQFQLERHMAADCAAELASFLPYLSGALGQLYEALVHSFPLENLKTLLRLVLSGSDQEPEELLIEMPEELALPVQDLARAQSAAEFVERVPLPRVKSCAWNVLPYYAEDQNAALIEMAFDQGYWLDVQDALGKLGGKRKKIARPVQLEFDTVRLVSVLRAARVYDMSWNRVRRVMPEGWGKLSMQDLQDLHQDPDPRNVADRMPWLGPLSPPSGVLRDEGRLEDLLWHRIVQLSNRQWYRRMEGPAAIVSYYYLKREELRHLLSLTQMLRLKRSTREIAEYLER